MKIFESMKKEKEIIESYEVEIIGAYSLVSNYGYKIKFKNKEYDLRHWLNCYGAEVNYWEISPISRASDDEQKILKDLENKMTEELK